MKKVLYLFLIFYLSFFFQCNKPKESSSLEKQRVIFIGFDAMTWKIMDPMLKNGKLPNFASIINKGVRAPLKTLNPTLSPAIWTTILTGVLPAKHGITGFTDDKGKLLTSRDRKTKSIWEICSENSIPSTVINFWNTWPVDKLPHCTMVTDRFIFSGLNHTTHPPGLLKSIAVDKVYPLGYMDGFVSIPFGSNRYPVINPKLSTYVHFLKESIAMDEKCRKVGYFLFENFETGLYAIYFRYLDVVQHVFWQFFESHSSDTSPELVKDLNNVIPYYYQYYDKVLGDFIETVPPNTIFVIVSDHGASSAAQEREYVRKNKVRRKPVRAPDTNTARRFRMEINKILNLLGYLEYTSDGNVDFTKSRIFDTQSLELDWNERKLVFNLKGQFPDGFLSDRDVSKIQLLVLQQLSQLVSTKPRKNIFDEVKPIKSGIFCRINDTLDPKDMLEVGKHVHTLQDCGFFTDVSGAHTLAPDGIFIISGNRIRRGISIDKAAVQDIMPTILYLLDLPLSKKLDGKILKDVVSKEFYDQYPPSYIKSYGSRSIDKSIDSKYDEKIEKQLKSLGYIQ